MGSFSFLRVFSIAGFPKHPLSVGLALLLFFLPAEAGGDPGESRLRVVDSFSSGTKLGKEGVPEGWALEGKPCPQSRIWIGEEGGGYLGLTSVSDSFGLKKEMAFDLGEFSFLGWQWRVVRHPEGGDIRRRDKDDQAGQVYVIFGKFPLFLYYRALGYIWDPAAPVGFWGTSRTYSRMKYRVIRSGRGESNLWREESRDVKADFRDLFQEEPPPVAGVLVFINTHLTGSSADCHYRNLFFSRNPKVSAPPEKIRNGGVHGKDGRRTLDRQRSEKNRPRGS